VNAEGVTGPAGERSFKSGFVSIIGRPNVGKSTLINQLVQSKVAIVSDKPQTTRNAIRGVVTTDDAQIVFIDTPGLHKPKSLFGERMNATVRRTRQEVDAVVFMLDASQEIGKGDAFIASELAPLQTPVVCVVNKADKVLPLQLIAQMEAAGRLGGGGWKEVLTTSATRGTGINDLVATLAGLLDEGPMFYPPGAITDQPETVVIAELIREKVLGLTRQEIPHSVAVVVDEMEKREGADLIDIHASIFAEKDSQKGILIGRGGRMLKEVGTRARVEIEALLGSRIFLDLRVKVEPGWQRDRDLLQRFGY
jgi:GTP-binding protein Era